MLVHASAVRLVVRTSSPSLAAVSHGRLVPAPQRSLTSPRPPPSSSKGGASGRTGSGLSCCLLLGKVHSEELPFRVHLLRARHQGRQGRYRERRSVSDAARLPIMCGLPKGGRCRVRIYLPDDVRDAPVVVCSERPSNPGGSITNSAEVIAAGVIRANELPIPQVWVEHWPEETTEGRRPSSWLFSLATRSRRRRPT